MQVPSGATKARPISFRLAANHVPYDTFPLFTQGNTITVGGDSAEIRTSVGVSLIWSSPLGPIRFDFAKAITKNPCDQTQIFNFTGGATF